MTANEIFGYEHTAQINDNINQSPLVLTLLSPSNLDKYHINIASPTTASEVIRSPI
jgi:hypothetical protein